MSNSDSVAIPPAATREVAILKLWAMIVVGGMFAV